MELTGLNGILLSAGLRFYQPNPACLVLIPFISRTPMILRLVLFALLCASVASAQQPMPLPGPGPFPRGNPKVDPNAPDTKAPKKHQSSSKEVAEKLHKALDNKNAAYRGSNIQSSVDDQTVTLTGSVTSSMQRDMAVQLARAYADDRQIVNKLVIQP
jgi:BON domain-containing protein